MSSGEKARVLVVDDEKIIRNIICKLLTDDGYSVDAAGTGGEAIELFKANEYELAFVDLMLPDKSGIDLVLIFKNMGRDTEIILITAYASLDNAIKAIRSGVYDYITKPFDDDKILIKKADHALEKVRLSRENRTLIQQLKLSNEELEKANRSLLELAVRDGLTGLHNHRYFQEVISSEVARAKRYKIPFSILFMDVDYFKIYNDANGHHQGDVALRQIATILRKSLRKCDTAARYGGEEFVLILPHTSREGAMAVAEKLRKEVELTKFTGSESLPSGKLTISVGISTSPDNGKERNEIIEFADKALYQAKNKGKNVVV